MTLYEWKKLQIREQALLSAVHSRSGHEKVSPTQAFWWSNASSNAENVLTLPTHLGKEKTCFNTILLYTYCVGVRQELPDRAHLRTARLLRLSYTALCPIRCFFLGPFFCLQSWFGWASFCVCTIESMAKHCFKPRLKKQNLKAPCDKSARRNVTYTFVSMESSKIP